jgi:hypothetical protein
MLRRRIHLVVRWIADLIIGDSGSLEQHGQGTRVSMVHRSCKSHAVAAATAVAGIGQ